MLLIRRCVKIGRIGPWLASARAGP